MYLISPISQVVTVNYFLQNRKNVVKREGDMPNFSFSFRIFHLVYQIQAIMRVLELGLFKQLKIKSLCSQVEADLSGYSKRYQSFFLF